MTRIAEAGRLVRETAVLDGGSPVVIELRARYLVLRIKGQRRKYLVGYSKLLLDCQKRAAEQLRAERNGRRGLRRACR